MNFTIFKDEIHKYIAEIWGFPRISPKYTEDLMRYSEIQIIANLNFELMDNVNVYDISRWLFVSELKHNTDCQTCQTLSWRWPYAFAPGEEETTIRKI